MPAVSSSSASSARLPRRRRRRRRFAAAWNLPGTNGRHQHLRLDLLSFPTGGIEPGGPTSMRASSTSSTSAAGRPGQIPAVSGVLDYPSPLRALHASRVSFSLTCSSSRTSSRPRRCPPSPAVTTSALAGRGLDRPHESVVARPSPRPGPTQRPAGSGGAPACTPAWADPWAGRFGCLPGLEPGLGRFTGRPNSKTCEILEIKMVC